MGDSFLLVDNLLSGFLAVKNQAFPSNVPMEQEEIKTLLQMASDTFLSEPALLEINPPIKICGDTHGQFGDVLRFFSANGFPPENRYLFLGDYVDRGRHSTETILLLLCYKVKYPDCFYLLRGNHECQSMNRVYGFYDEVKRRFSISLWKAFNSCFNTMPVCGLVGQKIFCMHGGISQDLHHFDQIRRIQRPTDIPDVGPLCDLLWADPHNSAEAFKPSKRGVSFTFSSAAVIKFCDKMDIDLVARGHQVVEDGYEFFANRHLVTIFSAPNYCGKFTNAAACLSVDEDLVCSLNLLKPKIRKIRNIINESCCF